jgi:hypothetical protein
MRHGINRLDQLMRKAFCLGVAPLLGLITACSNVSSSSSNSTGQSSTTTSGPQIYFAPPVAGATYNATSNGSSVYAVSLALPQTYTVDDQADIFSQTVFGLNTTGPQVLNAGDVSTLQSGLRSLSTTTNYALDTGLSTGAGFVAIPYSSPESGSYAVELVSQAGGLMQMLGQPAVPLVAATQCPNFSSAQTYQFITIPASLYKGSGTQFDFNWTPSAETAYGSVDIVTSGNVVTFQNIQQHTLGSGAPAQPSASSVTGACGPTVLGYTILVPSQLVITDPGLTNSSTPPQASIGIGPSGLLVEYNGATNAEVGAMPNTSPALYYDNVLGAGTGAVGLPQPSSALSTSDVVGAQYLGFIYGAGVFDSPSNPPTGWSSYTASFGFSSPPSTCALLTPPTPTLLYGGDFPNNNPASSSTGYGNCDFAIDLGTQDSSNNGLYPNAKVWVGSGYAANSSGVTYSFPAIAISGQLGGKYAIFVLGVDSTQPWAIYLLQSN